MAVAPGMDAMKKIPDEGFERPWPPLTKMDEAIKAKAEKRFGRSSIPPGCSSGRESAPSSRGALIPKPRGCSGE